MKLERDVFAPEAGSFDVERLRADFPVLAARMKYG